MEAMGTKVDQFELPVCNSFEDVILNNQLCYEVDLNRFSSIENIEDELKLGLTFIIDHNEDRQVTFNKVFQKESKLGLTRRIEQSDQDQDQQSIIYLNTVGK